MSNILCVYMDYGGGDH